MLSCEAVLLDVPTARTEFPEGVYPLRKCRFVNNPPGVGVSYYNGCIVVDADIHTNDIVAGELNDGVVGYDREDKTGWLFSTFTSGKVTLPRGTARYRN